MSQQEQKKTLAHGKGGSKNGERKEGRRKKAEGGGGVEKERKPHNLVCLSQHSMLGQPEQRWCPEPRSVLITHANYVSSSFWVISGSKPLAHSGLSQGQSFCYSDFSPKGEVKTLSTFVKM